MGAPHCLFEFNTSPGKHVWQLPFELQVRHPIVYCVEPQGKHCPFAKSV